MLSSPVFYVWLAWLLALAVFAVIRHKTRQREEQQREERRQEREARLRPKAARRTLPPDYRDQLVGVGVIKPALEPASTSDPTTTSM
jgi:heme exporter protein D